MKIYYYHTVDIREMYDGWRNGSFPGHFLYGATHLPKLGVDVIEAGFAIASPMDYKSVQAIAAAVTNCYSAVRVSSGF